jgi:hypothetical protein
MGVIFLPLSKMKSTSALSFVRQKFNFVELNAVRVLSNRKTKFSKRKPSSEGLCTCPEIPSE